MAQFYITCADRLAPYVVEELRALNIEGKQKATGVIFEGEVRDAYRAALWIRCGSRLLLQLKEGDFKDLDTLYRELSLFPWSSHMTEDNTFATHVTTRRNPKIHTHFAALRVKDAIADYFSDLMGTRPDVDTDAPELRFHLHIDENRYTLYLDFSGDPLHKRGFRTEQGVAPIRENLAAALLYRSNWPEKAAQNEDFIDPLCGAGTILIEAALMARDVAPGLYRHEFGFMHWRRFEAAIWHEVRAEAEARAKAGELRYEGKLLGIEQSARMIGITKANADRARVLKNMKFIHKPFQAVEKDGAYERGLIVTNPPYGERLGEKEELIKTYQDLGDWMRQYEGFTAGVITSDIELGRVMGIRAEKRNKFFNGPLDCTYLQFSIEPQYFVDREIADQREEERLAEELFADGGEDFKNRLLKNRRQIERWAKRENISCYRLYDADLPDFNVAIDRYGDSMVIYEYAPPKSVDRERAAERIKKIERIVPLVFDEIDPRNIHLKVRERQRGKQQYEKQDSERNFKQVWEGDAKLLVNLTDYLDTGLFLDHRLVRQLIRESAKGKRFLNLYSYTASATVHAANGGASMTLSVDLSRNYLDWAERNLRLNEHSVGGKHQLQHADVAEWLDRRIEKMRRKPLMKQGEEKFDLIFMDPPTFSNSKQMEGVLDIQRDHVMLINQAMRLLDRDGFLIFSTNLRRFKLDESLSERFIIEDRSKATLPEDFRRNPKIRQCYIIKHLIK